MEEHISYQRVCPICGDTFSTNKYNRKYDSKDCRRVAEREHKRKWVENNPEKVRAYYQKTHKPLMHPNLKRNRSSDNMWRYYFNYRDICDGAIDYLMIKYQMPLKELYNLIFPKLNEKQIFCKMTGMSRDRYLELKEFMGIKAE